MSETITQGTPSRALQEAQEAQAAQQSGGFDYTRITTAQPEEGIFPVVGGYFDGEKLHNVVHLKAPTGYEEDIWGNSSLPFVVRMNEVLVACTKRYGSIENPGLIRQAVIGSPQGTRLDMLLALRTFSNYAEFGWIYDMEVDCVSNVCRDRHADPFKTSVDLRKVGKYHPPHPEQDEYTVTLPRSGAVAVWRRMTSAGDQIFEAVLAGKNTKFEQPTWSVLVRLLRLDDQDISVGLDDVLDHSGRTILSLEGGGHKNRMGKRGLATYKAVKRMLSPDRDFLRGQFLEHEPALDIDVQAECPECGYMNRTMIDLNQSGFLFPQATSTNSKRIFSTT